MACPNEKLFPVPKAVEMVTGHRPHPATYHRWRQRGISGAKLETLKIGGRRETSVEAVHRFIAATTAAADGEQPTTHHTNRQREAAIARAERELDKAGNGRRRLNWSANRRHCLTTAATGGRR